VPEILEVLHLPDEHGVAEMQIGRRRVEANLDYERPAKRQPTTKVVQSDNVDAPLRQTGYLLLVEGHEELYRGKARPDEGIPEVDY